jgi:hypothetical protein
MAIDNPNIPDRSNTNFFTGPIGAGTVLTAPIFVEGDLPTADPLVEGQVWLDAGALKVSAGP